MATLDELKDYLADATTVDEDIIFKGSSPDAPDDVLVLYEYPGNAPEYVQESFDPSQEKPQIQVVARSKRYEVAKERADIAWQALARITNATLGSTRYRSVRPNGSPGLIRRDANDRLLVGFNASVEKEVSVVVS